MENLSLYDAGYEDGYKKGYNDALNFMMDLAEKEENDPDIELGFNSRLTMGTANGAEEISRRSGQCG